MHEIFKAEDGRKSKFIFRTFHGIILNPVNRFFFHKCFFSDTNVFTDLEGLPGSAVLPS